MTMRSSMSGRNCQRSSAKELAQLVPSARFGGVYVQTRGPRIETVAEVKSLAWIADVVGMTVASEATLACELGMQFAALCTIENYANGLGDEVLTYEHIVNVSREHRHRTEEIVNTIIDTYGMKRGRPWQNTKCRKFLRSTIPC